MTNAVGQGIAPEYKQFFKDRDARQAEDDDAKFMRESRTKQAYDRARLALEMAARLILAGVDSYAEDCEEGMAARELTAPLRIALDVLDVADLVAEEEWWEGEEAKCQ